MGRTYLFLSGKGGTGKTTLSTSLGMALARKGKRTVLVDADVGLRCADLLLGMENDILYDLSDVAELRCTLPQALVHCREAQGFSVLSAPQRMKPSEVDKIRMAEIIQELTLDYDYVLIDCPAGLGRGLRNVWNAAEEAVVVTTPDDASVRAAERLSQLLFEKKVLVGYYMAACCWAMMRDSMLDSRAECMVSVREYSQETIIMACIRRVCLPMPKKPYPCCPDKNKSASMMSMAAIFRSASTDVKAARAGSS